MFHLAAGVRTFLAGKKFRLQLRDVQGSVRRGVAARGSHHLRLRGFLKPRRLRIGRTDYLQSGMAEKSRKSGGRLLSVESRASLASRISERTPGGSRQVSSVQILVIFNFGVRSGTVYLLEDTVGI